jgi:amino acid transporter
MWRVRTFSARVDKQAPPALPTPESLELPETLGYRIKNKLLGPPLVSERLATERLGKPTALAVLSSDVMSSSAYATEQMLVVLVPIVGAAAFSLVLPLTAAILVVLAFVCLSYREVIAAYPKAGGAYVVSRDNFGLNVAQVASAALLIDYTLTVAVSVAAGVDAVTSAFPVLAPYNVEMAVGFVVLIAYGNLRGVREAGRAFALPTFFFIGNMALMIVLGLVKAAFGELSRRTALAAPGTVHVGHPGSGLFLGASLFFVLQAFANGGTALTGTEAISNGVSVFREPQARNARQTLVAMSVILGSLFLGVSVLASLVHPVPYLDGTPTVLSQLAKAVYGRGPLGTALFLMLQAATMAILVLAANTSFTGFPFLASFAAEDRFLPRQLTRRGHRLVFSNGIVVLTVVSVALLVATDARVSSLIALYAIGVFTGFTMAGAGMVRHHLRTREAHWRRRAVINGSSAVLSFVVDLVFAVTKFTEGAWLVVVLMPLMVFAFVRLNREYRKEAEELEAGAAEACEAPTLRRHAVLVLVDRLDLAVARAIQYARALHPDEIRAVHFVLDSRVAEQLREHWAGLGLKRFPLEIRDCPDRRLGRAALELVAETLADGETEVSVVMPRRAFRRGWSRILHDRTADRIAAVVSRLPHANATIVPYQVGGSPRLRPGSQGRSQGRTQGKGDGPSDTGGVGPARASAAPSARVPGAADVPPDVVPIAKVRWRQRAKVAGRVASVRVQPRGGDEVLVAELRDETGGLTLVFTRRDVAGIETGARLVAEGMVGEYEGHLAMLNPLPELLAVPAADPTH